MALLEIFKIWFCFMMNNKELISILTGIEADIDVNRIKYDGYCIWPLVRIQLAMRLMHASRPQIKSVSPSSSKMRLKQVGQKISKVATILNRNIKNGPLRKKDLAFMIRTSERSNLVGGTWYSRHGDCFSDLFEDKYSIQLIEFSDNGLFPKPQPRPSFFLDIEFSTNEIKRKLTRCHAIKRISGFSAFMEHLDKKKISWPDAERRVSERLQNILGLKNAFTRVLKKLDPALLLITCCYCEKSMAAILACNDLKIPVIEFQHGAQNDNNPFLTHWTKVPADGYEMLPDLFWNWGEASAERIQQWAGKTTRHKAFVGGNLWISKWIRDGFQTDDCKDYDVVRLFPPDKKHLLISLQMWPDSLPAFLLDILRASPSEWFWHIRQHPRHSISEKELNQILGKDYNVNYEFHSSSSMPLYLLLKQVDLHLTGYSTVAFEAAQFSVPTIFYHTNARDGFKRSIDDNLFCYADDRDRLLFQIKKKLSQDKNVSGNNNYIEIDSDKPIECLKAMIDFSKSE
ncbi:hypothetical protein KQH27_00175 [bacterium]|nr:hypothetical protein [bacterium]